jgi:hypothetical protein
VRELKRPGMSLLILWDEYREAQPDGYSYSRCTNPLRGTGALHDHSDRHALGWRFSPLLRIY